MDTDIADRFVALEQAIAALTDEKAIRELVTQYAFNADLARFDDWVDLFTHDGVMDLDFSEFVPVKPSKDELYFQGRDELMRFITAKGHLAMLENFSQHHTSGQLSVTLKGDEADAFGYSFVIIKGETAHVVASEVFRRWRFRRVEGVWRISGVKMRPAGSSRSTIEEMHDEP